MKKMKKIFAVLLTLAMVLGMTATVFAAGDGTPTEGDSRTANVTITGIGENDATFKVLQIIEPEYLNGTFTGSYKWCSNLEGVSGPIEATPGTDGGLTTVTGLTSDNVQKWAANATTDKTVTASGSNVTMNLGAGTWIIVATPKQDVNKVYNPMIASVYYTKSANGNTWVVHGGNLNAAGTWGLGTSGAYTKSTDLTTETDKKVGSIVNGTFVPGQVNGEIGTSNTYQLKGIIPSYSSEYFSTVENGETVTRTVYFNLQDSQNGGLEYQNDLVVKVGGSPVTAGDTTYTLTYYKNDALTESTTDLTEAKGFKIAFASSYIQELASAADTARRVEVTYSAKITAAAVQTVAENTYKLYYTRTPGETEDQVTNRTPIEKKEDTYTASINGTIKKVDGNGADANLLAGASFGLYRTYENGVVGNQYTDVITEATGTNGMVKFGGLKFGATYYIKETAAPAGYSLSDKVYAVTCNYLTADVTDGVPNKEITQYTVTVKDADNANDQGTTFTVNYGGSATVLNNAFPIVNTTLASLPSTGGIGTTIFTIGGCAIMIIAAGLYFATRRRTAK